MSKKSKFIIFYTFATFIYLSVFTYLGYQGFNFLNAFRHKKSNILLSQSQNTTNIKSRILFAQLSNLINPNDQAKIEVFKIADSVGNKELAQYNLIQVEDFKTLDELSDSQFNTFKYLVERGYPQAAIKYTQNFSEKEKLTRDQNLSIASVFLVDNEFREAYFYLKSARDIDPYYPQTYQQLVLVTEKLGQSSERENYQKILNAIDW